MTAVPRPPAGLGRRGRALWRDVMAAYHLDPAEAVVLEHAAGTLDLVAGLQAELAGLEDLVVTGSRGQPLPHPVIAELRRQRLALAQLLRALRLPDEAAEATSASVGGRHLAAARWQR